MSWGRKEQASPGGFLRKVLALARELWPLAEGHGPAAVAGTGPGAAVAVAKALRGRGNGAKGKGDSVS